MQRKVFWLSAGLLALGVTAFAEKSRALPTDPQLCRQAYEEVQKTNELLHRAAPVIRECSNDTARFLFRRAVQVQGAAIMALRNHRCVLALELTKHARRMALRALQMCGPPGEALPPPGADPGE